MALYSSHRCKVPWHSSLLFRGVAWYWPQTPRTSCPIPSRWAILSIYGLSSRDMQSKSAKISLGWTSWSYLFQWSLSPLSLPLCIAWGSVIICDREALLESWCLHRHTSQCLRPITTSRLLRVYLCRLELDSLFYLKYRSLLAFKYSLWSVFVLLDLDQYQVNQMGLSASWHFL